jgi:hypothetical protein
MTRLLAVPLQQRRQLWQLRDSRAPAQVQAQAPTPLQLRRAQQLLRVPPCHNKACAGG